MNKLQKININNMKKYFLIALLFISCSKDKYHYRVVNLDRNCVYYTDTIEQKGDSLGYHNSDGSYVFMGDSYDENLHIYKIK